MIYPMTGVTRAWVRKEMGGGTVLTPPPAESPAHGDPRFASVAYLCNYGLPVVPKPYASTAR